MLSKFRCRLTYANVVSTLALFVAVSGGAAYATHLVVRSSDIVNDQVKSVDVRDDTQTGGGLKSSDIKTGAIFTGDVQNESLLGADISDGSLTRDDINMGTLNIYGSLSARINNLGAVGTTYGSISGTSTAEATPDAVDMITGPDAVRFNGIAVRLNAPLQSGQTRMFVLSNLADDTVLGCTIRETESFCANTTVGVSFTMTDRPVIEVVSEGVSLDTNDDARIALDASSP